MEVDNAAGDCRPDRYDHERAARKAFVLPVGFVVPCFGGVSHCVDSAVFKLDAVSPRRSIAIIWLVGWALVLALALSLALGRSRPLIKVTDLGL